MATNITPATLSVESAPVMSLNLAQIPSPNFKSLKYINAGLTHQVGGYDDTVMNMTYTGPSDAVNQVIMAVASGGKILPITPAAVNSSWSLDFHGPFLQCHDVTDMSRTALLEIILLSYGYSYCDFTPNSMSWTP